MKISLKPGWTCHRTQLTIVRHLLSKFVGNIFDIGDASAEEQLGIPVDSAYCAVTTAGARICGPHAENQEKHERGGSAHDDICGSNLICRDRRLEIKLLDYSRCRIELAGCQVNADTVNVKYYFSDFTTCRDTTREHRSPDIFRRTHSHRI